MDPSTMMIEVIWGILGHLGYFRSLEYFKSFEGSFEVIWGGGSNEVLKQRSVLKRALRMSSEQTFA